MKVDMQLDIYPPDDIQIILARQRWMGLSNVLTSFLAEFYSILDYPKALFSCCDNPEIVSADGITYLITGIVLSIESDRIKAENLQTPWKAEGHIRQRATERAERSILYLPDKADRLLLHTYARKGLQKEEYDRLLDILRSRVKAIVSLLQVSSITDDSALIRCHPTLVPFFSSCSKSIFPALHFIPPSVWPVLEVFLETRMLPLDSINLLSVHSPMLAGFFSFYHQQSTAQKESLVF